MTLVYAIIEIEHTGAGPIPRLVGIHWSPDSARNHVEALYRDRFASQSCSLDWSLDRFSACVVDTSSRWHNYYRVRYIIRRKKVHGSPLEALAGQA